MVLDDVEQFLNSLNLKLNEQQRISIMEYKPKKDLLEELGSSIKFHAGKVNHKTNRFGRCK